MMSQSLVERVDPGPVGTCAAPLRIRVRIPIASDADVALAGEQARRLATRLAFGAGDVTVITTALQEIARNILAYGGGRGDVLLHLVRRRGRLGVSIVARDHGPGIADVRQALRDGCSTSGRPGLGLPSARRLMDEFLVRSWPGRGTIVTMRKWAPVPARPLRARSATKRIAARTDA